MAPKKHINNGQNQSTKDRMFLGNIPPLYDSQYNFFNVNELDCLIIHNTKVSKSYVSMAVYCGSADDTIPGLAHLLEHLLFISPDQESECNPENTEDKSTENKKVNAFDRFLADFNGHSNAYTSGDCTVYHYEIDTAGTSKSLQFFANFFKNPRIEESTVKNEMKVVNTEFENRKYKDYNRFWRLHQIITGKQFGTGNFESFGTDYNKIVYEAKKLFSSKYKKMVLVILSSMEFPEVQKIVTENFNLNLQNLKYSDRKCLYCEQKESSTTEKAPDSHFKKTLNIKNCYRLKAITPTKKIYITIPLISIDKLPFNIYDSLVFFFTKNDYSSLFFNLKKEELIIDGSFDIDNNKEETFAVFNLTVENTDKYQEIIAEIEKKLVYFKSNQGFIEEQTRMSKKIEWKLEELADPRDHIVDCADHLLKSNILFTDVIFEHECNNIEFKDLIVILMDSTFEITEKRDYYELFYENLNIERIDSKYLMQNDTKTDNLKYEGYIYDPDTKANIKKIEYQNNDLIFIRDNLRTQEVNLTLFFKFDVDIHDEIRANIAIHNIRSIFDTIFKTNGISIEPDLTDLGFYLKISGIDPFFILVNFLATIEVDLINHQVALKELKSSKIYFKNKSGYERACYHLRDIHIPHSIDIDEKIKILDELINKKKPIQKIDSFFNKIQKVVFIVNGAENENIYLDFFKKICDSKIGNSIKKTHKKFFKKICESKIVNSIQKTHKNKIKKEFKVNLPIKDLFKDKLTQDIMLCDQIIKGKSIIQTKDKAISLSFRIGKGVKSDAMAKLIVHVLHEQFFTKLRTEMQLGYIVGVSRFDIDGDNFIIFVVQSPENVLLEIIKFIQTVDFEIKNRNTLKNAIMSEFLTRNDFDSYYLKLIEEGKKLSRYKSELCKMIDELNEDDLKKALNNAEICLVESEASKEFEGGS